MSDHKNRGDVLHIENLRRQYGDGDQALQVLVDANLTIKAGEMVALVAPSGTGKSTLLHSAGLLERPDVGDVFINGEPTKKLADRARTNLRRSSVGFVYQFHHLLPEFTAEENIVIPQMLAGVDKKQASSRAQMLLSHVGIADRARHRPSELSGGEQQRVAIVRAIANEPSLLLADEPTGNLDPSTSLTVFDMLTSLVRETGLAALIATHNHELAARMDRCVSLSQGKVVDFTPQTKTI